MSSHNLKGAPVVMQTSQLVNIVYYTDPLCCWSWALERELTLLEKEYPGTISWRYCMSGLLPGWKHFIDNNNSIVRPAQMGPLWMHASQALDIELAHRVWIEDPPASSYPACIAVKCAGLQSPVAEKLFLYYVRKAVMEHGLNIAKKEVLEQVADCVADVTNEFSYAQFIEDINDEVALEAFRKDLQEVKYRNINRFPTLLIQRPASAGVVVTGYRPADVLLHIINEHKEK